jgi:hypothetical protein
MCHFYDCILILLLVVSLLRMHLMAFMNGMTFHFGGKNVIINFLIYIYDEILDLSVLVWVSAVRIPLSLGGYNLGVCVSSLPCDL